MNDHLSNSVLSEIKDQRSGERNKWRWITLILFTLASLLFCVMVAANGYMLYQIYSCTDPDGECRKEQDKRTADIIQKLDAKHLEIEADIAELNALLEEKRNG